MISRLFFIGALRWEYKLSKFRNSEALSEYLTEERELALSYLCDELNCDRESLAFIIDGSDIDHAALEIPRV